ncbi:MAG: S-adenosylmethionine:tRNA ribosyltransferase-isomerase, partial [Cytophagaceae bacterium]|nr:S-adenosylmethionine:tRNA ribosyltransferase-isomerase [Cytophagaceae bacterium]
ATSVGATSVGATSVGGAVIELFLLHPVAPTPIIGLAMQAQQSCTWSCLIGNRKRWKPGEVLRLTLTVAESSTKYILNATLVDQEKSLVHFSWNPVSPQAPNLVCTFADILQAAGQIPLPPYLKRNATDADRQTYQTVYSQKEGAVAAPTAGLHLTDQLLDTLRQRGFGQEYLTLHVGAGTFQPVKTENALDHPMHGEQVVFTRKNIENFRQNIGRIIPVGTTSLRAMESLYWLGVQCGRWAEHPGERAAPIHNFRISQFEPYQTGTLSLPAPEVALAAVLRQMELENVLEIVGETHIMIVPGYQFRLCTGLITNFHQPGSTLLLLIAALLGQPHWRQVYNEALTQNYRFLSYGDASLLLP